MLLLGTTDTPYEEEPGVVAVEQADVTQILDEAAVALGPELLDPSLVRATYAGLRVLPAGPGESVSARRETVYTIGRAGMLSVAGGKLTTYRRIALEALDRLRADVGLHRIDKRPWPLPGAETGDARLPVELEPGCARAPAPSLRQPGDRRRRHRPWMTPPFSSALHADGPDIAAQALYAVTHEWARNTDDVLRRRTTVTLRGLADDAARSRVESLF